MKRHNACFNVSENACKPVNVFCFIVVPVVAYFVEDISGDKQAACKPYGKPEQVDEGNEFILHQIAERYFKIILYHKHISYLVSLISAFFLPN